MGERETNEIVSDRKRNVLGELVWKNHPEYIASWPLYVTKGRKIENNGYYRWKAEFVNQN